MNAKSRFDYVLKYIGRESGGNVIIENGRSINGTHVHENMIYFFRFSYVLISMESII